MSHLGVKSHAKFCEILFPISHIVAVSGVDLQYFLIPSMKSFACTSKMNNVTLIEESTKKSLE